MSFHRLFRNSATIERCVQVVDDTGVCRYQWSVAEENVPCLLQKVVVESEQDGSMITARAYFDTKVEIRPDKSNGASDRIVIDGVRYGIVSTECRQGSRIEMQVVGLCGL